MVKTRFFKRCGRPFEGFGMFLNDDGLVFCKEDNFDDFIDLDLEVCRELGLLPKEEKSFISVNSCVFCENYIYKSKVMEKRSYVAREYKMALNAVNIVHAK